VGWNTVHLQVCLCRLRADGQPIDDTDLRFLSPLMQRHSGIYGQYHFAVQQYGVAAAPATLTYEPALYAKACLRSVLAYDFSKILLQPQFIP